MNADIESIWTQIARDIIKFSKHELTKEDLYLRITNYCEIATGEERKGRETYDKKIKSLEEPLVELKKEAIYSNWVDGYNMITNSLKD